MRKGPRRTQPWRVILTKSGRLPQNATIFRDSEKERTLVYRNRSLRAVLRDLGRREITSVLIEGGGDILSQALDQRLIDKVNYIAPLFTGGNVLAFGGKGAAIDATIATAGFAALRTNWSGHLHHRLSEESDRLPTV